MLPQEANRKFRLFALDATSTPRIHAHTPDDRSYVHQANQIGIPVTVGLEASVLTYLPEHSTEEANWQLPVSLERISTETTACKVARTQLQLLAESNPAHSQLTVIVADCAYGNLEPYSEDQIVIARGRTDRQGRRPAKNDPIVHKRRGRPRKYESGTIRFGQGSTRPWHKKRDLPKPAGPGEVKRLFATRIFPVLGSPSHPPTNREKSRGRKLGTRFPKRERKKVVKKRKERRKAA